MSTTFDIYKDDALEQQAQRAVSVDEARALLDVFSTLVRESGTPAEDRAGEYIVERLKAMGISVTLHTPDLFISLPTRSELRVATSGGDRTIRSRPPAFAVSTDGADLNGDIVYVPSRYAGGTFDLFDTPDAARGGDGGSDPVAGKIVLTEGFSMPGPVEAFTRRGAIAQIYIHSGEQIHEGICTPIWGAPTAESISRKPRVPVVCVNRPDGDWLVSQAKAGRAHATIRTWLREGWMRCLLPVADIRGTEDPDEFLLVHGHYDSWYEGIGDNATGDAALLELARILHGLRGQLKRSVRIAWWPGHSTGRYAGSTWFADTFADEIDAHCIAQLDIDSPGCAGATAYEEVMWMAEADRLCVTSIHDALGEHAKGMRPLRAGDYSFNQIGPTGLYMLLSNIPQEERKARGFYAVGGCGGNIAWHTPKDLMDVADLDILRRDLLVYVTTIVRILNAPLYPFDYAAAVEEIEQAVAGYQRAAAGQVDLEPVLGDLRALREEIARWQADAQARLHSFAHDAAARREANAMLRRLARILVPLNYAKGERFDHDPALKFAAVPRLEAATHVATAPDHLKPFLRVGLIRERNKIRAMLRAARREVGHGRELTAVVAAERTARRPS